jgi:GxxExxY protein
MTRRRLKEIAYETIGCAIEVHRHLGPGLLETVYHRCFLEELARSELWYSSQVPVPIVYKGASLDEPLKPDILVEDILIVELKAVEAILPVHRAQVLTYLKLTGKPKALLINFFTDNLAKSVNSIVGPSFSSLPEE